MSEISEAELFVVQMKWEAIPLPYAIFDFELSVFISITYKHSPIYCVVLVSISASRYLTLD